MRTGELSASCCNYPHYFETAQTDPHILNQKQLMHPLPATNLQFPPIPQMALQRRSRELPNVPEYTDSTGRVVVPMRNERCPEYADAWRSYAENLDPQRCLRQNLRQVAEVALDCPIDLAYNIRDACKAACEGIKVSR